MKERHQLLAALGLASVLGIGYSAINKAIHSLADSTQTAPITYAEPSVSPENVLGPEPYVPYEEFRFTDEIPLIFKHAERLDIEPELLMAIRTAENGAPGREYGIIPNARYAQDKGYTMNGTFYHYINETEKQVAWCARTVRNNLDRFALDSKGKENFIDYLGEVYCPVGASNDPRGLNRHWEPNVQGFYEQFKH